MKNILLKFIIILIDFLINLIPEEYLKKDDEKDLLIEKIKTLNNNIFIEHNGKKILNLLNNKIIVYKTSDYINLNCHGSADCDDRTKTSLPYCPNSSRFSFDPKYFYKAEEQYYKRCIYNKLFINNSHRVDPLNYSDINIKKSLNYKYDY